MPKKSDTTAKKPSAKKTTTAKPAGTKKTSVNAADVKADRAVKAECTKPPVERACEKSAAAKKTVAKKHILFVCSEAFPFAGTGGLGEVMGSLPAAINDGDNYEARVILPLYDSFPKDRRCELEFVRYIYVQLSWRNQYCGLFRLKQGNTVYYFVDNEYYYKRSSLYGHGDDVERFAFLSKAVLDLIPYLDYKPDVLHCNDWQTALVPIYYKLFYMYRPEYSDIKTVFTIHNIEYQGWADRYMLGDVFGIPDYEFGSLEHFGEINLMKGAIDYSDSVTTVSPTYAQEILSQEYGHTLDGDLVRNAHKLRGILNGVDTATYDPETNPALFAHYSADDRSGKATDKRELQKMLGLPERSDVPVIAMITRLAAHKGVDIVKAAMDELMSRDVQVIMLGTGDSDYENYFRYVQDIYGNKMRAVIAFNKDLSHKIYSGADMFLMPSRSEPCGLSQMMACRYGTIPIVRETGGLKDSITDAYNGDFGNGYKFARYAADDLVGAVDRALGLYRDYPDKWNGLVDRAMRTDFSWKNSAKEYVKLYNDLLSR